MAVCANEKIATSGHCALRAPHDCKNKYTLSHQYCAKRTGSAEGNASCLDNDFPAGHERRVPAEAACW